MIKDFQFGGGHFAHFLAFDARICNANVEEEATKRRRGTHALVLYLRYQNSYMTNQSHSDSIKYILLLLVINRPLWNETKRDWLNNPSMRSRVSYWLDSTRPLLFFIYLTSHRPIINSISFHCIVFHGNTIHWLSKKTNQQTKSKSKSK